uniref:Uncharacterized protein n=1 Tax=Leersia perrieri TaxID=77586 RepID=A0A0D9XIE5_9ORYZ
MAASQHIIALPYPGRGHINPMLAVCCRHRPRDHRGCHGGVARDSGIRRRATLPDRIGFATVPNVIPSEHGRGDDHVRFIVAVHTDNPTWLRPWSGCSMTGPDAIIADTYVAWGVDVGVRRGIPVCSLWTMAAMFFWTLYNLDLWPPVDDRESEQAKLLVIGAMCACSSDTKVFRAWELPMKIAGVVNVRKAQGVLFTSFYELEPDAINRITETVPFPDEHHRNRLDAQQEKSVLYVSFGSHVSLPPSQLEELTIGLRDSGVKLFWVGRDKVEFLQQQIAHDMGLVVPWCEQLKVLCHPSIGGFMSHCGWNSMLDAAAAGVPLLAFPVKWDQLVDGHIMEDEWKIGINLREQRSEDGIVSRTTKADGSE